MSTGTELTITDGTGIDLDGLRVLTRPEDLARRTEEDRRQWLSKNGYDLSIDLDDEKTTWIHGVGTNLAVIPNDKWDDADLTWVGNILQAGNQSSPLIIWELPKDVLPMTFAFRTANGKSGMFRITAYSHKDKRAVVQVKLNE